MESKLANMCRVSSTKHLVKNFSIPAKATLVKAPDLKHKLSSKQRLGSAEQTSFHLEARMAVATAYFEGRYEGIWHRTESGTKEYGIGQNHANY